MNRQRAQTWLFLATIILAFMLQLLPLPQPLLAFKPFWLALVLVYWSIEAPERVGLGFAFLLGLAGDVVSGELLGEQALRLIDLAFIVLRFRSRLRFFPM
ncbi:MAG: rod shape-determining protein MreD, partial [Dokdonella sp.]